MFEGKPLSVQIADFPMTKVEPISYGRLKELKDADLPDILTQILQRIATLEDRSTAIETTLNAGDEPVSLQTPL